MAWMFLILTIALNANQPCSTSSKVFSLVSGLFFCCCCQLLLLCFHLSRCYIFLSLCLILQCWTIQSSRCLIGAVQRGDSEKCLAALVPFPGSEDSKRWQPGGSSGFSLSTADVDKFRNPPFFQQTDLIRRGPSVCNQSRARISSLRVVDNGP